MSSNICRVLPETGINQRLEFVPKFDARILDLLEDGNIDIGTQSETVEIYSFGSNDGYFYEVVSEVVNINTLTYSAALKLVATHCYIKHLIGVFGSADAIEYRYLSYHAIKDEGSQRVQRLIKKLRANVVPLYPKNH